MGVTHYFSIHKARTELHYSPGITSQEGARRMAGRHRLTPIPREEVSLCSRNNCNRHYFRLGALHWWVLILLGMGVLTAIAFDYTPLVDPSALPSYPSPPLFVWDGSTRVWDMLSRVLQYGWEMYHNSVLYFYTYARALGYGIFRTQVGIQWVFYAAVFAHVYKAAVSYSIARDIGCCTVVSWLWCIQSLLLGE